LTIEQIKVGYDNFAYIVYCKKTKKAALIDPGYDAQKLLDNISSHKLNLQHIIITHHHSDHIGGIPTIKKHIPSSSIVASKLDGSTINADIVVSDEDRLSLGDVTLNFLLTPGHTAGGLCVIVDNKALLTGDTLFIGDCGRTDLSGGSLSEMHKTLQEKIMVLPDYLIVYPGHDYGPKPFDTLGHQKKTNKTLLAKTLEDFSKIE
jgi:glyoxylase-like metal-dependent hydrolase (beta-lactamase superfamily II)